MYEDMDFSVNEISLSNLRELSSEIGKSYDSRLCELAFIADSVADRFSELTDSGMDAYGILTLLSEYRILPGGADEKGARLANADFIDSSIRYTDMASFAGLILEKLASRGIEISERDFLPEDEADELLTYVKNPLADEAFDVFSLDFDDPRVAYADSNRAACFAVADGKVGYCILPFEESGARIPGIYSMINALELKIAAVIPVFGADAAADMKYALVGRSFRIPKAGIDTDRYLEIRLSSESAVTFTAAALAAEYFGLDIFRLVTMPEGDEGAPASLMILRDTGSGFTAFLAYLAIFAVSYSIVGIYENIE
ncbi:MAG: hypothetical protein E7617_05780 [Ruminococcaceae bacterium]|nr:hypothetical protein [Oscillospiraceae bacterium]